MNHLSSSEARGTPWLRIVAAVWLLALSVGLVVVMLDVTHLGAPPDPSPQAGQLDALAARLGQAEQQLSTFKRVAPPVTPEALATVRAELETRLALIEASVEASRADPSAEQTLLALQGRVAKLEASPPPVKAAAPVPRTKPIAARAPKVPQPPFQVMGVELRGGERFLSVAPRSATSLSQIRLLRVGESEGSWTLEAIGSAQATFRVDGKALQLVMP
ncbi:hypothetical protein [Pseudomonas sp. SBT1-2]|uniref:hypothetical protein n=1 Tax=Pseudomonas sp. SBT1-2 TaxID=3027852 RepID=UPI00235F1F7F|nr:hypothetical protein [Pseudomonas sp. SBT1-2]